MFGLSCSTPENSQNVHVASMEVVSLIRMNVEFGQPGILDVLVAVQCTEIPRGLVSHRYRYGGFL
jgi:hypothetical protein